MIKIELYVVFSDDDRAFIWFWSQDPAQADAFAAMHNLKVVKFVDTQYSTELQESLEEKT